MTSFVNKSKLKFIVAKDFYSPKDVFQERFLTVDQVAERLQLSKMTIYRYLKAGKIAAYDLGKEYRIKQSDLEEFLEKKRLKVKK